MIERDIYRVNERERRKRKRLRNGDNVAKNCTYWEQNETEKKRETEKDGSDQTNDTRKTWRYESHEGHKCTDSISRQERERKRKLNKSAPLYID